MKIYVVTGANRGIGLELVRQIASQGNQVIVGCRNPEAAVELHKLGSSIQLRKLDVSAPASVQEFSRWILDSVPRIDVLINNAGMLTRGDQQGAANPEELLTSYQTNAIGPLLLAQALMPVLQKAPEPVVINITSKMGSITENSSGGYYAYRMSKAALNMATMSLVKDHPRIRFLVLHPGWVKTDMGGSNAPTEVEDSVRGLLDVINKTKTSGAFLDYKGQEIPW